MSLREPSDAGATDPVGRVAGLHEEHERRRTTVLAEGTLACPRCDAPALPDRPLSPAAPIACGWCGHGGPVRDFLSLGAPARPARVVIRIA